MWNEVSPVAGKPPCSSASLIPSLITTPLPQSPAPLISLFGFEHVEPGSSLVTLQQPFPVPGTHF